MIRRQCRASGQAFEAAGLLAMKLSGPASSSHPSNSCVWIRPPTRSGLFDGRRSDSKLFEIKGCRQAGNASADDRDSVIHDSLALELSNNLNHGLHILDWRFGENSVP